MTYDLPKQNFYQKNKYLKIQKTTPKNGKMLLLSTKNAKLRS